MIDGTIIVNNDTTNTGRYLLPLLGVVGDELAKIDTGRIKVSRGLRDELQQVWNAIISGNSNRFR